MTITPIDKKFYHPVLKTDIDLEDINTDKTRLDELNKIINSLKLEIEDNIEYYTEKKVNEKLQNALVELEQSKK